MAKKKLLSARRQRYKDDFPGFTWQTNGASPEFVRVVQEVVNGLDFRNTTLFPAWHANALKAAKKDGRELRRGCVIDGIVQPLSLAASLHLGKVVFSQIPNLLDWIPFNDAQFLVQGNDIKVVFRSLLRTNGPQGAIFYSRHEPTLEIDSQHKIVGFSDHAIKRTCDRIAPTWHTYRGFGDAFALFDQTVYFERADFHDGQLAFTFYDNCAQGYHSGRYVDDVLGGWNGQREGFYYRVGYCPAVIEGDFIKAKTLLFPGQHSTPEYGLLARSALPREQKQRLKEEVRKLNMAKLRESGDLSLIKWFHDNGIPQVIHTVKTIQLPAW